MAEPLSPELALVDADLGERARAALPERPLDRLGPRPIGAAAPAPMAHDDGQRPYPLWARMTAALWLLVLGILIGGAAIPHAQDKPRVVPKGEDVPAAVCPVPDRAAEPETPALGSPLPGP